jgi:CBS domain-containing protein
MPHRPISQIIARQPISTAAATLSVVDAARQMAGQRIGALLVIEGRLVGIFTERDALFRVLAAGRDPATTTLGEVMTADPITIAPDKPFGHALHLMYEGGFRHVPVVVRDGTPVGMVSARDLLGPELQQFALEVEAREHISEIL